MDFDIKFPILDRINKVSAVFKEDTDWQNNACIGDAQANWYVYVLGYKKAGDVLVKFAQSNPMYLDSIVYPIIFLYRHYLELAIKIIILRGSKLIGKNISHNNSHKLSTLWCLSKKILAEVFRGDKEPEFSKLDIVISEFDRLDSSSFEFRYPVNREGKPNHPDMSKINVRLLSDIFEDVERMMEFCTDAIEYKISINEEWQTIEDEIESE